jgi:NAD(P)-dependent dehydrogenase (short-subunit alcohol dehydrogenase family)
MRLSAEERLSLEPMARKYTSVYCDVIRAKIILLADEGLPNDLIAAIRAARSHAQPPATAQKDSLQIALSSFTGRLRSGILPTAIGPEEDVVWGDWGQAIEINLLGTMLTWRAVLPLCRRRRAGIIVNLGRRSYHAFTEIQRLCRFESRAVAFHGDAG